MVGIVVVGHGRLAEEMVQTLEGVLGPLDGLASVATTYSDTPDASASPPRCVAWTVATAPSS